MFRQDRTNPSTAVSNWRGRHDTPKAWPSTGVSTWLNGGLFGGGGVLYAGYIGSGVQARGATGEQLSYPNEVGSVIADLLPWFTGWVSGCSNNGVAGYTGAGYNNTTYPGGSLKMSKWMFATNVRVDLTDITCVFTSAQSGQPGYGVGCYSNSGTAGYIATGTGRCGTDTFTTKSALKTLYANDTQSIVDPGVVAWGAGNGMYVGDGSQNSGVNGYYAGGIRSTSSNEIDRFPFSTETPAALSATMSVASHYTRCTANQGTAQYIFVGSIADTTVNKLAFSGETVSTLSSGLSAGKHYMGVHTDSNVAMYAAVSATNYDRWALASDTRSTIGGLTSDRTGGGPSGFSNAANF